MVKLYGPMMSLDASGTLADSVSFSKWKGRPYARERVIPSNPRSGPQVGRRNVLGWLSKNWSTASPADKASWQDAADNLVVSPFNACISENLKAWHNFLAPSFTQNPARTGTPGGWSFSPIAAWQENRIQIAAILNPVNDNAGVLIFASDSTGFSTAVANLILCENLTAIDWHFWYWTPPKVTTWYFNSRLFTTAGLLAAEEGEFSAIP